MEQICDGPTLYETDLRNAILTQTDLSWADLRKARLVGANLTKANFHEADLRGTDLRGADLAKTRGLSQKQLNQACVDNKTQLPKGLSLPPPCAE